MLVSWAFASLITNSLWFMLDVNAEGTGAISFGLSEAAITSLLVIAVGAIVYLVLGWLGSAMLPALANNRVVVMALLGGLAGSLIAIYHLPAGRSF